MADRLIPADRLQEALASVAAEHPAAPAVLAAVRTVDGAASWGGAVGRAERGSGERVAVDACFRIASVTKTFVAVAALRLVADGRVGLDQAIDGLVSTDLHAMLRDGGHDPGRITLRHLLAHTSGLYNYGLDERYLREMYEDPRRRWSRLDQVGWALQHGEPTGEPGERFAYSDTGYLVVTDLLERCTGTSYAQALRDLARLDELALQGTYLESLEPSPPALTRLHQYDGGQDTYDLDPSMDLWGGGGLVSTVHDLAAFGAALAAERLLDAGLLAEMKRPLDEGHPHGLGVMPLAVCGQPWLGHTGYWGVQVCWDAPSGIAVAVCVTQRPGYGSPHPGTVVERLVSCL